MGTGGTFVISLDFELLWGVRDAVDLVTYRDNLVGERIAVRALLDLFERRGIHATWATVGALFCASKREFENAMPERIPRYMDTALSPYEALSELGKDEASDPFHYAPSLIEKIVRVPGQELATHTFSHFYCLEPGQVAADFEADLVAASAIGTKFGAVMRSIVFPRNQYNPAYRGVLTRRGLRAYRSNGSHWAYRPSVTLEPPFKRLARLADAYVPLSGSRTQRIREDEDGLTDVPASAFLRPFSPLLRPLERARYERVARAMTQAARGDQCFHLWWHPHNFGKHLRENVRFLTAILDHFDFLRASYGMTSASMIEAAAV